ncbi:helix-turn-helix domain-containing protein [Gardnerella vaginalis]|uniref:helix-turn-helix domain-containing protein n=1 Tax=Gardnerella vaginalis TaxID=2702 RepID=UPI0039EF86D4
MNINEDEDNKATQWIAARLEQAVQESGMRIKSIAEKAEIPGRTLRSKRKGESPLGFKDIAKLAAVLHKPIKYFVPPMYIPKEN